MSQASLIGADAAESLVLSEHAQVSSAGIVSRTVLQTPELRIVLFAFDAGRFISLLQVMLEGAGKCGEDGSGRNDPIQMAIFVVDQGQRDISGAQLGASLTDYIFTYTALFIAYMVVLTHLAAKGATVEAAPQGRDRGRPVAFVQVPGALADNGDVAPRWAE